MDTSPNSTRREFLVKTASASAAVSVATVLPSHVLGRDGTAPNEKISLGVIGIRTRENTSANPDVMRRSHIASHAAAIAWTLGRKLKLDPVKEEFIDDAEANLLRSRAARNWAVQ